MSFTKYKVYNKYTYDMPHQTDYTYNPYGNFRGLDSEALMKERYIYRYGTALLNGTVRVENKTPVRVPADFSDKERMVFGAVCVELKAEYQGFFALTFTSGKHTYMLHAYIREGAARLHFSLDRLGFLPDALTFDYITDRAEYVSVERVRLCSALDTLGRRGGQKIFYTVEGGTLESGRSNVLRWRSDRASTLVSPEFPDSSDTVYNMKMPRRNTVFMVIENNSDLERLTFAYRTWESESYCAVNFFILPNSGATAYYINLSDTEGCRGRLRQFKLIMPRGGDISVLRYSFEYERPIKARAGEIISCTSDGSDVCITGRLYNDEKFVPVKLSLFATTPADDRNWPDGKQLLYEGRLAPSDREFVISGIPFMNGNTTLLPYQLLLLASDAGGNMRVVGERFYIENYWDFSDNRYGFELPDKVYYVSDFGACGNAFTDDTEAVQSAIDEACRAGGGRVVICGDDSFYGRRYIVTCLLLRDNVELCIEKGAVIWQSQIPEEYAYRPSLGHDGIIQGVNWTHCMHVCNLPLIQAENCRNVKITGGGKIRMLDTGSEEGVGMPGYSTGCRDRIHIIPIGFFNVHGAELSDFEIVRSNNYHSAFYHSSKISLNNLKLHEVKCVSGDGFGLGFGTEDVYVNRCIFQSNDDGVVLWSCAYDPRGIVWWTADGIEGDCGTRRVEVAHSYLNSGGGKAIAFITWGTCAENQERAEISDIYVHDNILSSVNPVGAWPDNPYNGKQPFDNTEADDYSPVKNVRIFGNAYIGNCTIGPIRATNFLSDCGIYSHGDFVNGDFSLGGLANWNREGNVYAIDGGARIACGKIYEGLYLPAGSHIFRLSYKSFGEIRLFAELPDGTEAAAVSVGGGNMAILEFETGEAENFNIGVSCEAEAFVSDFSVETVSDAAAEKEAACKRFNDKLRGKFVLNSSGKLVLTSGSAAIENSGFHCELLTGIEELSEFRMTLSIRVMEWSAEGSCGYGFCFGDYNFFFNHGERRLILKRDKETVYCRENFFFTSDDYHIFTLNCSGKLLSLYVDTGKLDDISLPAPVYGNIVFYTDGAMVRINDVDLVKY